MADNKRSFLLYADYLHTVSKLPDKEAGVLFKTILKYVNDENPRVDDIMVDLVFEPIKQQLKRDLKHWEAIKDKRSEAGKASAEAKKLLKEQEQTSTKSTNVESVELKSTKSTVIVNDNVTVTVNVNGTVINIEDKSSIRGLAFISFLEVRKKLKKPFTIDAIKLAYKKIEKLAPNNFEDQAEIINQSVMNGWQGIFPLNKEKISAQKESKIETILRTSEKLIQNNPFRNGNTNS